MAEIAGPKLGLFSISMVPVVAIIGGCDTRRGFLASKVTEPPGHIFTGSTDKFTAGKQVPPLQLEPAIDGLILRDQLPPSGILLKERPSLDVSPTYFITLDGMTLANEREEIEGHAGTEGMQGAFPK